MCRYIYLYTDGVARDCSAFLRSCGRAGGLCCYVYGCMQVKFVLCSVGVLVYLCIYISIVACGGVVVYLRSCIWIDIYIQWSIPLVFALVCLSVDMLHPKIK